MKLATFQDNAGNRHVGAVHTGDSHILDLALAAGRSGRSPGFFASMLALMEAGDRGLDTARELLAANDGDPVLDHDLSAVALLSPVPVPQSIRDFVTFPGHILNAPRALQTLSAKMAGTPPPELPPAAEVPPVYQRQPNFYKGNRFTVIGTGDPMRRPRDSQYLDYELEFGVFTTRRASNIGAAQARQHIFGYAIFNDFSARDIQVREMGGMTGPCKSKDFDTGNAIGPWIVTADEIPDPYRLTMTSRVNGETWCTGTSAGMIHSFEDMVAYVSRDETIHPGEFFGSGTVGGGTGMELGRFLDDGDVVELEVTGLGVLRNQVTAAVQPRGQA
ncbi:MAG: fumarylacetoacetate hydrolase family protein [Pseudomonadota bacterium]